MRINPLVLIPLLLTLSGCPVGPDYVKPEAPTPSRWVTEETHGDRLKPLQNLQLEHWWRSFGDPVLDALEQKAFEENLASCQPLSAGRSRGRRR